MAKKTCAECGGPILKDLNVRQQVCCACSNKVVHRLVKHMLITRSGVPEDEAGAISQKNIDRIKREFQQPDKVGA